MPNPDLIPEPFAQSGDKNPIPLERAISDPIYRASWKAGFPPDTRIPKDIGGEPPDGLDFNGVLNILSQAVVFLQKGNAYQFDAALTPYPIGALVRSNDNLTTYQSTVPNNSNNPNINTTGWRVYSGSGLIVDNLTTNDSAKALSAAQGKALQDNKLDSNKIGVANGVASLDANIKVPVVQLPAATISNAGVLRFATAAEVANKTNVSASITPANVGQTFEQSLSGNGWCKLPNGLIMQWGTVDYNSNPGEIAVDVVFPSVFPTSCLNVTATRKSLANNFGDGVVGIVSYSSGSVRFQLNTWDPSGASSLRGFTWFAIGY